MKRFRFTIIAVCLFLLWLGGNDLWLALRNPTAAPVSVDRLLADGPPQEWLNVTEGTLDVAQAISTSGSVELDALLVPLLADPADPTVRILVETRDPAILGLFTAYHFQQDTDTERAAFLQEHRAEFAPQREVTGMLITGLIARGNREKLEKLAQEVGMPLGEQVLFLSEGQTPDLLRGLFFFGIGAAGIVTLLTRLRRPTA